MGDKSIISFETIDGVAVGRVYCNVIGQREAPIIQAECAEVSKAAEARVALDFSGVTMMGSLALGTLVTISRTCKAAGGGLALFGLNDNLTEVLKMSRLDKLLPIAKNEAAAIKKTR
jgi:anti-anti-sigma factor